jgi:hypothetical protein
MKECIILHLQGWVGIVQKWLFRRKTKFTLQAVVGFDLQFCYCPLCNRNLQIAYTYNRSTTGLQTSKLGVKTKVK